MLMHTTALCGEIPTPLGMAEHRPSAVLLQWHRPQFLPSLSRSFSQYLVQHSNNLSLPLVPSAALWNLLKGVNAIMPLLLSRCIAQNWPFHH